MTQTAQHTELPSVDGLPFRIGDKSTYHGLRFTEIQPTGKIGKFDAELVAGPVARVNSEYAEFIVRACNAHNDLVAELKAARSMLARKAPVTPDDLRRMDAALAKATGSQG